MKSEKEKEKEEEIEQEKKGKEANGKLRMIEKKLAEISEKANRLKLQWRSEKDLITNIRTHKSEIEKFCKEAIKEAPQAVEDYKKGNEKALNFVVGIVMKKSKGKATPKEVNEILKSLIK